MSSFLRRFFCRDFGPPPSPDLADAPTVAGQTIVEALYSDSKKQRAIITRDPSEVFRVHIQFWDTSDWKAGYGARWSDSGSSSFTDTIEAARTLAREALAEFAEQMIQGAEPGGAPNGGPAKRDLRPENKAGAVVLWLALWFILLNGAIAFSASDAKEVALALWVIVGIGFFIGLYRFIAWLLSPGSGVREGPP